MYEFSRRRLLQTLGSAAGVLFVEPLRAAADAAARGVLIGEPTAERVAARVFADGGNAFDAAIAGGLAAAISSPYQFGIGGYGGHATLVTRGKQVSSVDFNTSAPGAARADMFQADKRANYEHGWLATGVPGILAGLQFVLDHHGTMKLADLLRPAIALAREGIAVAGPLAAAIAASARQFAADPASRRLYFQGDRPLRAGDRLRNPELAEMLDTLARRGSVESFYRGDIALVIADGFRKNGGLVTAKDLARFTARAERPFTLTWNEFAIHTAPLTAGGMTFIQALHILQAVRWQRLPAGLPRTQAKIEALRLAWRDRLTLLGDPRMVKAPVERLLSEAYARDCANRIEAAVKEGRPLTHRVTPRDHAGTINLSAADREGNFIAITLTHGNAFGARVTVPGLGLTLGHGMSRFDTDSAHPNVPGPHKKPLNNMCPSVLTRQEQPVLALGGRGGRRIQNAMFEALLQFVVLGHPLTESLRAPRCHTEGNMNLNLEKTWPAASGDELRKLGYAVQSASSAVLSGVALEKGNLVPGMR